MSAKYLFVFCLTLLDATSSGNHSTGELRIVLLGKSGAGKSATGNTILGREEAFREDLSFESVTSSSSEKSGEVSGRKVLVVDTPGLYDTSKTEEELKSEIERCVNLSVPGPHVFLLVIRLGVRFTEEEENAVKWIQANFGQRASLFTMVLFTHADELHGKPLESILHGGLRTLIDSCGGGCHAFDNAERDDKTQVEELLQKIDAMVRRNRGEHYTNWMYQKAQREMREEEERRRQEEERKQQEEDEKIRRDERLKIFFEENLGKVKRLCPLVLTYMLTHLGKSTSPVRDLVQFGLGYEISKTLCDCTS